MYPECMEDALDVQANTRMSLASYVATVPPHILRSFSPVTWQRVVASKISQMSVCTDKILVWAKCTSSKEEQSTDTGNLNVCFAGGKLL